MDWTVAADLRVEVGLTDEQVDALVDALHPPYGASIAVGSDTVGAIMTISGPRTAAAAAAVGRGVLFDALRDLGVKVAGDIALEAMTTDEHDRRLAEPTIPELAGVAEVADMLGVSKQRVYQLHSDNERFPEPVVELRMGPLWTRVSVEAFNEAWSRKPGRPARSRYELLGTSDGKWFWRQVAGNGEVLTISEPYMSHAAAMRALTAATADADPKSYTVAG